MAEHRQELQGPDLAAGVAPDAVPEGGALLGHVGDEPVLLVRSGGEIFATGAVCTHYSGPLHEGLVVGDTIRCPWHHACFSLRTGTPISPPALDPIPCWLVQQRDGRIVVTGKAEPGPARLTAGEEIAAIVVVGAGAAGGVAAETLRREGYRGRVTIVGGEPGVPVDRPNLSKDYLAGTAPEAWVTLRPPEFYQEHEIELVSGVRATALDPEARRLTLEDERTLAYDRLLLATGAEPVRLSIPGAELPHVRYLRTLTDSRAIVERAKNARRAVVLGASFIGLEVAASLRARGLEVHVVAPDRVPLERVMGEALGGFVQRLHEAHGVVFHLGRKPSAIEATSVPLDDGTSLAAELVVAGIGVRPSVALAERAGLAVDGGVVTDEYLETSRPGIYAAGDIARWPDAYSGERIRVEHWVVAERQARTAARNMLGARERFTGVPFFWSQHYDVQISYVGHAPRWDAVEVRGSLEDGDAAVVFRAGGRVRAVATVSRDRLSLAIEAAMERLDHDAVEALWRG